MGGKNKSERTHVRVTLGVRDELARIGAEMAEAVGKGRREQDWEGDGPPPASHVIQTLVNHYRDWQRRRAVAGAKRVKGNKAPPTPLTPI